MPWLKDVHFNPVGAGRDVIGISGLPACPDNVDDDAVGNVHRHPIIDRQARGEVAGGNPMVIGGAARRFVPVMRAGTAGKQTKPGIKVIAILGRAKQKF